MGVYNESFFFMLAFLIGIVGTILPIVLVILLIIWLTNKRRRDEDLLGIVVQIRETLLEIQSRLGR